MNILKPFRPCPLVYALPAGVSMPGYAQDRGFRPPTKHPEHLPDGTPVTLSSSLADAGSLEALTDPARTWIPIDGNVKLGIFQSLEAGAEPLVKPAQLARSIQRPGHAVTLGDGQSWLIPTARLAMGSTALPRRRKFDSAGNVVWQVEPAYLALSDFAARCWDVKLGHSAEGISDADVDRFCGEALAVNYRLSTPEAIALGLFSDDAQRGIIEALLDWPTVLALVAEKKE